VVVRRVLERAALRPASDKREKIVRQGITLTPANGVPVVQQRAPLPAVAPEAERAVA
jgi:hypothetical protein